MLSRRGNISRLEEREMMGPEGWREVFLQENKVMMARLWERVDVRVSSTKTPPWWDL